jgi:hypothetical protein
VGDLVIDRIVIKVPAHHAPAPGAGQGAVVEQRHSARPRRDEWR